MFFLTTDMINIIIQGTAGVAIAGLLGAVRAQGKQMIDFPKQKIVVAGAGRSDSDQNGCVYKPKIFCLPVDIRCKIVIV